MIGGSHVHLDKYLGVAWADRPPTPSGPSARQVLQYCKLLVLAKCFSVITPSKSLLFK